MSKILDELKAADGDRKRIDALLDEEIERGDWVAESTTLAESLECTLIGLRSIESIIPLLEESSDQIQGLRNMLKRKLFGDDWRDR